MIKGLCGLHMPMALGTSSSGVEVLVCHPWQDLSIVQGVGHSPACTSRLKGQGKNGATSSCAIRTENVKISPTSTSISGQSLK